MLFFIVYGVLFLLFVITFLIAKQRNKHDYIDILWGGGLAYASVLSYVIGNNRSTVGLLITLFTVVWGVRLAYYLFKRNVGTAEDPRYIAYRQNYSGKNYDVYFFFRMYLLQYILNVLISFHVIYFNLVGQADVNFMTVIGIVIWCVGFFFEAVGDAQLRQFKKNPLNKGKLLTTGLWRYTRHPNYFGEVTMWWGIYLMINSNVSYFWLLFSPLLMNLLIVYVSGVPILEKRSQGRKGWEEYARTTSKFIPLPPKQD